MGMTPANVEQKTFSTVLRGYDLDEVDDFLDDVVATIRELQDQVLDAKAGNPVDDSAPVVDESAIGRVLMTAQTTADTMIADAREEANQILADAMSQADSWAAATDAKKAAAEEEMAELTHHVAGVRTQLAVLATVVADRLDEMDQSIANHQADQDRDVAHDADEDSIDGANTQVIEDDSGDDDTDQGSDAGSVDDEEDGEFGDDSTKELSSVEHDDRDE